MPSKKTVTLYRPVGQSELDLIREASFREFPPRLAHQPIFYPVLNEGYAIQIAGGWNTIDESSGYVGYVTRFEVEAEYLQQFDVKVVGGSEHEEYWIPSDELEEFNKHIVGPIEVISEFRAE